MKIEKEFKMKCSNCGKEMENAVDSRTKEINKYLWKCDCKEMEGLILSVG